MTALRDSWDDVEPELRAVAQELRLEVDGDLAELSAGEAEYANDRYRFALDLPAGFPLVRHAEDPTPQLEFGAEFADLERSPLVAVSVGVARAPGGVGNSQSRVLQAFYREAVDELRAQPTVVAVRAPRTVELNGSSAWLVDVSRKRADGTVLRTRTYDVWRDDYVYSVVARGRASEWAGDWQVLSAIVESFEVG